MRIIERRWLAWPFVSPGGIDIAMHFFGGYGSSMSSPTRAEVDAWPGQAVLEFGASWCPICQNARGTIDRALATRPGARHVWIEDGPGQKLGRSFGVKLWPTLIVLRDGVEVGRVVRPRNFDDVTRALAGFDRIGDQPGA